MNAIGRTPSSGARPDARDGGTDVGSAGCDGVPLQSPPSTLRRRSLVKKMVFSLIATVLALGCLEGILAAIGVEPVFYEDPFVGFAGGRPLFTEGRLDDGTDVYTTSADKLRWFNQQSFPQVKAPGTFRIFCLGGSTTVGRPYDDRTSFAGWLREFLTAADPSRRYEVINAGGVSYASYRVANLMKELVRYEPDLFILYTGHNEFLESHTYRSIRVMPAGVRNVTSQLSRTRLYAAAHRLIGSTSAGSPEEPARRDNVLPAEVDAILDRTVGPESYVRDDQFRSQVLLHFTSTLHRIIEIAQHAGADIILVETASNLRDCAPFKSQHRADLTDGDLRRWQTLTSQVQQATSQDRHDVALAAANEAAAIDDRVAMLHYRRGQMLWSLERFAEAGAAFRRARDEDVCPLRALTSMRQIVRDVAQQRNVRLIPFATELETRSPHGVPGAEWFLDHVHPTIEGHQLLADLIQTQLTEMAIVSPAASWNAASRQDLVDRVMGSLDPQDHAVALRNLAKVLTWAGKFEEADRLALQELPADYEAHFLAGNAEMRRQNHQEAIAHFETTVTLQPRHAKAHNNLGSELFQIGELDRAAEHFEHTVRIDPTFTGGYYNLGVVHLERGELDQAVRSLRRALQLEPDRFDALYALSKAYYRQDRPHDALRSLQQAVRVRPTDETAREDLRQLRELLQRESGLHSR